MTPIFHPTDAEVLRVKGLLLLLTALWVLWCVCRPTRPRQGST
jgi:hypothetical protein